MAAIPLPSRSVTKSDWIMFRAHPTAFRSRGWPRRRRRSARPSPVRPDAQQQTLRWKDTAGIFPAVSFGGQELEVAGRCVRDEAGVSADVPSQRGGGKICSLKQRCGGGKICSLKKSF